MTWMRFCVLDVGQGSANFIEVNEDDGDLQAAALIDIGSEQWKRAAGKPSAGWIAEKLQTMEDGAVLEAIVLSHSDSDHVNLIPALLDHFDPPSKAHPAKPVLTIERIYYAGDYGKYKKGNAKNFLERLDDYRPTDRATVLIPLPMSYSSFDRPQRKWQPLVTIGGEVDLWVVSANTTAETIPVGGPSKKRKVTSLPDGYGTNTRSVVVAACFGGRSVIATGDATGLTLSHCNRALARPEVRAQLGPVFMVTLPHHGSDTTTYDLTGSAHGSDAAKQVVTDFATYVDADTISASAGERSTFRHPSPNVIADLGAHMLLQNRYRDRALEDLGLDEHFFTAYYDNRSLDLAGGTTDKWPPFAWWYTARTGRNVYTTDYFAEFPGTVIPEAYPWAADEGALSAFVPAPPRAISWAFDVAEDGTRRVDVARERDASAAAYWEAIAAHHDGPLPEADFVWVPSADRMDEGVIPITAGRRTPRRRS